MPHTTAASDCRLTYDVSAGGAGVTGRLQETLQAIKRMKPTMASYLSSLTLGEEVLFKCNGQIYQERVEKATVDFLSVDKIRFNRNTGTESPLEDDEELSLDDCAILVYPSSEALETYKSHKKRRMTSAHIKAGVATGLLH